eukprot:TRINITY_DN7613_c0_g1_i9.p3 TRINITY_DN7613_c0_g1~~TRINITY_DN7613_c0_g1_i9.p3  ORF type:complete len:110 (-),score=53.51 TRINITY_DN7613_c0_g1_i9:218-547(-)
MGVLNVTVVEAKDLPPKDASNTEVFVSVQVDGTTLHVPVKPADANPKWGDVLTFQVADPATSKVVVEVKDKVTKKKDKEGKEGKEKKDKEGKEGKEKKDKEGKEEREEG